MKRVAYSQGEWHYRVPRDVAGNLAWRKYVLTRCEADPKFRRAVLQAVKAGAA